MKYIPEIHHRRSIRLKGYDYSQSGAYFITICTQNRECFFGKIDNGKMVLNNAGIMVETIWNKIPQYYCGFCVHENIVMPNHFHGIIEIVVVGAGPRACPDNTVQPVETVQSMETGQPVETGQSMETGQPVETGQSMETGQPQGVAPTMSLSDIVHRFKTMTTKKYIDAVKQNGWTPFPGKLWQRNYYEHIIRNEHELNKIREYIQNNPLNWDFDRDNPSYKVNDTHEELDFIIN